MTTRFSIIKVKAGGNKNVAFFMTTKNFAQKPINRNKLKRQNGS
jgi:hypothetical protein